MLLQPRYKLTESEGSAAQDNVVSRLLPLSLSGAIKSARETLLKHQQPDGHWVYELEADCTIPAEYILMNHFTGEIDDELEQKIAVYLREQQDEHDGWSLYHGGCFDLSCSVKAYYALKLVGDDVNAEHMVRARNAILTHGGSHSFAEMVSVSYQQGVLLVTYRDGAVVYTLHAQTDGSESAWC
jgi:squalene-hopene/tetraprenyl-beta-curcumene cyclase